MCVDLLWSRFNKLPARRKVSKWSKSTSYLFIFYSIHTTQILGLCLSVAITFWHAVSSHLGSLFWFCSARQLKKLLSHSRAIPLSLGICLSFVLLAAEGTTRITEKTLPSPSPSQWRIHFGLACALCAPPLGLPAPATAPSFLAKCPIQQLLLLPLLLLDLYAKRRCRRRQLSKAEKKMWAEDKRCVDRRRREGEGQLNWSWALRFWLLLFLRSPLSTPIPCGFVYVRRLCCVSVINEITLFLLLLPPPGISCFCFLLLAFVFVVYFSITFRCSCCFCCCHVFCFVSCCCPLACRQSLQRRVRLRLWLRFICFYLSFSRFTYWAESSWPRPLCCLAAGAANFAQISNAFCGLRLRLQLRRDGGLGLSGLFRLFAWRK